LLSAVEPNGSRPGISSAARAPVPKIAAQTAKPAVKPLSCGKPPGRSRTARTAATAAAPMLLPIERAKVLTPVAAPVCAGGTCAMTAFGRAA
jgi:hypothetical protein